MKISIFLIFAAAITLFSCGKKSIIREYYLIEFPVKIDSTFITRPSLTSNYCEILPVQVAPAYAQKRIAVRTRTNQLNYYLHHEWAVLPEEAITAQLEIYLRSRKLFSDISGRLFRVRPNFSLDVQVHHLEVAQEKQQLAARLHMTLELRDNVAGQPLIFHTFDVRQTLAKKDLNLFASTLSDILAIELKKFADKIEQYLQSPRKPAAATPVEKFQ